MSEEAATVVKLDPASLERHIVPVKDIVPNPWNPNQMDDRTFQAERESIRTFGFIDPVIGRPKGKKWEIIDGEHRWRAATEEGYEEIFLDSVGPIDDAAAKKLTIILNETRGEADIVKLGVLLADIQKDMEGDVDALMLGLPYTNDELTHMLSIGEVDWSEFKPGGNEEAGNGRGNSSGHAVALNFDDEGFEHWQRWSAMLVHEGSVTVEVAVLAAMKAAAERV